MRSTSALYKRLLSIPGHYFEYSVVIGEKGRLITRRGERILFGGFAILVDRGGANSGYNKSSIISLTLKSGVFQKNTPSLGNTIAGEIELKMLNPAAIIPRMAQVIPYCRVCANGERSEWLQMGVFYIDTREVTQNSDGIDVLTIHGYDSMLITEQEYPLTGHDFPCSDLVALDDICSVSGIELDPRTTEIVVNDYQIEIPSGYSCRDTLGYIAALYGGNFIINDDGLLQLVQFGLLPKETRYLIEENGYQLLIGGDHILV